MPFFSHSYFALVHRRKKYNLLMPNLLNLIPCSRRKEVTKTKCLFSNKGTLGQLGWKWLLPKIAKLFFPHNSLELEPALKWRKSQNTAQPFSKDLLISGKSIPDRFFIHLPLTELMSLKNHLCVCSILIDLWDRWILCLKSSPI
jgi:hypothetical protein